MSVIDRLLGVVPVVVVVVVVILQFVMFGIDCYVIMMGMKEMMRRLKTNLEFWEAQLLSNEFYVRGLD